MITKDQILAKASDTKALIICQDAEKRAADMFNELFPGATATIIADTNTYKIAGEAIYNQLKAAGIPTVEPFILDDPDLYAEWSFLERIEEYLKKTDAIGVAVGSGVINDLTKLSSEHLGRRYMICGTAASMDGYTAYGASITYKGNKQTFCCRAPKGILLDPIIAAAAPKELAASGYADLIAKIPAGADWMIADALGKEAIDEFAWELLNSKLKTSLSNPEGVHNGDIKATEDLAELLIMSGFAMQTMQSSRPASGTEHQYSHCWDIENLCIDGKHVSHGFKVGIGTLVSTASLEFLLNYDMSKINVDKCIETWPTWKDTEKKIKELTSYNHGLESRCLTETKEKYTNKEDLRKELDTFLSAWPTLKEKIRGQILPYDEVKDKLRKAGAPYEPEMIHVSREHLRHTFRIIPYMRSRYTNVDIISRLGLMNELEQHLFGKGGKYEI